MLSYTISRWVTDQVIISDEKDYKLIVDEVSSKSSYELKVYIVEKRFVTSNLFYFFLSDCLLEIGGGKDDSEEKAEHEEAAGSQKKQIHFLTHIFVDISCGS